MQLMPGLESLKLLIEPWKDTKAYIVPMKDNSGKVLGNNGDELMHRVFHKILDEFGIARVENAEDAGVLIVPPNGALLEMYSFPQLLADQIRNFRETPLVIFPSSSYFPGTDPSFIFEGRRAPTLWILRERNSLEHLTALWYQQLTECGVELALDHDVVASGHKFVPDIIGEVSAQLPLVSARLDKESSPVPSVPTVPRSASKLVVFQKLVAARLPYGKVYTALARWVRKSALDRAGEHLVAIVESSSAEQQRIDKANFVDASSPEYATFSEYTQMIANASTVITDRLHVGLPAAIVGKEVVLVEAGYHKLGGVYKQSLAGLPNVTFIHRS